MTQRPRTRLTATARWSLLAAFAVIAGGLLLRIFGVASGLPFIYDADETEAVEPALRMLQTGSLNPGWFGFPASTTIYSFWLLFYAYLMLLPGSAADLVARFQF